MVDDLIKRQYAIDAIENITWYHQNANKDMICGANSEEHQAWYKIEDVYKALNCIPSAQSEQILYANMSDAEFEKWLYEHGICHPNIHESIPCDVVPLLIDNAISELPSAQPQHDISKANFLCPICGAEMEVEVSEWEKKDE